MRLRLVALLAFVTTTTSCAEEATEWVYRLRLVAFVVPPVRG